MSAREIKFGSITIDAENNHVTVTFSQDGTVWMTETEIARLFGVFPWPSEAISGQSIKING